MTIEQARTQIEQLKARLSGAFSTAEKQQIRTLYELTFGRTFRQTSCQRCYHDAVIEIYLKLRKMKKIEPKCSYRMRAGFIVSCPTFHGGKIFTNDNLTDEIAEEYIALFPNQSAMFDKVAEKRAETAQDGETTAQVVNGTPTEKKAVKRKKSKK